MPDSTRPDAALSSREVVALLGLRGDHILHALTRCGAIPKPARQGRDLVWSASDVERVRAALAARGKLSRSAG